MKLSSFFLKFNKSALFHFIRDLAVVLLYTFFIVPFALFCKDYVADWASFGLGFFFCMISDGLFSVVSHHTRKAYYYRHVSQPERARVMTWEDYKNGRF